MPHDFDELWCKAHWANRKMVIKSYLIVSLSIIRESTSIIILFNYFQHFSSFVGFCDLFHIHHTKESFLLSWKQKHLFSTARLTSWKALSRFFFLFSSHKRVILVLVKLSIVSEKKKTKNRILSTESSTAILQFFIVAKNFYRIFCEFYSCFKLDFNFVKFFIFN